VTIRERTMHTKRGHASWLEAGAGWPVILLHAFPLNADMWRPQLAEVPAGWRLICPDLRGFGSLPPEGGSHMVGYKTRGFRLQRKIPALGDPPQSFRLKAEAT